MGPSWVVTSLQKSYFKSSIAGLFTNHVVYNTKNQETQNKIFLQQLKTQSMNSGKYVTLSNWDIFLKFSEHFRTLPKIFKKCHKIVLRMFRHFPIFFEDSRRFPKTSDNFQRFQKNSKMLEGYFKHFVTNFRRFPKTSDDFQRFLKKF